MIPTPPVILSILELPLESLIALPDSEAAQQLDRRALAWDRLDELAELAYADRGIIAIEIEKRELWRYLGFSSFSSWAASRGRRSTFYAKASMMELVKDVPAEALRGIGRANIDTLVKLSTADRQDPEILDAARKLSGDAFAAHLEKERPNQHIERKGWLRVPMVTSALIVVDEAIIKALSLGCKTRAEAVEYICAEFLTSGESIEQECMPVGRQTIQ